MDSCASLVPVIWEIYLQKLWIFHIWTNNSMWASLRKRHMFTFRWQNPWVAVGTGHHRDRVNCVGPQHSGLWIISWLPHQMFYPYVTISAAQACESDDLRHATSPFSLFLSYFLGTQRILGYVGPRRIAAVHPPERIETQHVCFHIPVAWCARKSFLTYVTKVTF